MSTPKSAKPSSYDRIRKAMRERENYILREVRKANRLGFGWDHDYVIEDGRRRWSGGAHSMPSWNALDRLEKTGRIKFVRGRLGSASAKHGYWIA